MKNRYVVVDLETTGNASKMDDRIIQFAAVVIEDGVIVETYSSFIQPQKEIPPFITELTHITDEMVADAPLFEEVAPKIVALLKDSYFVAHNVHFDLSFLQGECERIGVPFVACQTIDTVELARILLPTIDSYKLNDLSNYFGFSHDNPHQADSDAYVTAQMFLLFMEKISELPVVTLQKLQKISKYFKSDLEPILSAILIEKMMSIQEDETMYDIHRGIAIKKRTFTVEFDDEEKCSFPTYKEDKLERELAQHLSGFEKRVGQFEMMDNVYEAFANKTISCIEAGTGIGKTLAYLLPSVFMAREIEQPIVISTHTTQLQHQIMEKDIPLLKKIVPFSFDVALIKGRSHYLCLHKFEHILYEEDSNYDNVLTKAEILIWLTETETGDVDELNLPTGGAVLWNRMCSDAHSNQSQQNPWHSRCFYQRAINRLFVADMIVTNHALLFSDLTNQGLLSAYEYVVLDEAHHVEEVASRLMGKTLHARKCQQTISRLGTLDQRAVLWRVSELLETKSMKEMDTLVQELKFESDDFFRLLHGYVIQENKRHGNLDSNRMLYRYCSKKETPEKWSIVVEVANRLYDVLRTLLGKMEEIEGVLKEQSLTKYVQVIEFINIKNTFERMKQSISTLLLNKQSDTVTWIEMEAKGTFHSIRIYSQPIDISMALQEKFFTKKKSVIFTSATLTVNHSFDYMLEACGLQTLQPTTLSIPSPFAYDQLVNMFVPTDVPSIKEVTPETYVASISSYIAKLAKATDGKMLVLFTSTEMLKDTYASVKEMEEMADFVLLAQNVNGGSRSRLTKNFQQFKKAILFGTATFWEGIDVPGEDLSCLVMVRLPFSPPGSPISQAKIEKIKEAGGSPFNEYSLPQAIIRFKQGFGRLIRKSDDKGIFVIMDRRIMTASYGTSFVHSIPPVPLHEMELEGVVDYLKGNPI